MRAGAKPFLVTFGNAIRGRMFAHPARYARPRL